MHLYMNTMNAIRISRDLLLLAHRQLLASRRSKVVIVVDENQFGIIPGLRALGYNNIKTFPAGTPDQVIHDALNKMRQKIRRKPILLVTENVRDFNEVSRHSKLRYTVVSVPAGMLAVDVPAKLDTLIKDSETKFEDNKKVEL